MDFKTSNFSENSQELKDIFFNRPVSSLGRPKVVLLAARNTTLSDISKVYEIIASFGHNCILIVDEKLKLAELPADVVLQSGKQASYSNSNEAVEQIENASALFVMSGGEVNASMEVLVSKLELQHIGFVQTDTESLINYSWDTNNKLCLSSTRQLLSGSRQSDSGTTGLKLKADNLFGLSEKLNSAIAAVDPNQALALDSRDKQNVAVINSDRTIDKVALSAIIFALLAERSRPLSSGWLNYVLAAGYLYRKHYFQSGPQGLRRFLNSQF